MEKPPWKWNAFYLDHVNSDVIVLEQLGSVGVSLECRRVVVDVENVDDDFLDGRQTGESVVPADNGDEKSALSLPVEYPTAQDVVFVRHELHQLEGFVRVVVATGVVVVVVVDVVGASLLGAASVVHGVQVFDRLVRILGSILDVVVAGVVPPARQVAREATRFAAVRIADDHVTNERSGGCVFLDVGDTSVRRHERVDHDVRTVVVGVVDLDDDRGLGGYGVSASVDGRYEQTIDGGSLVIHLTFDEDVPRKVIDGEHVPVRWLAAGTEGVGHLPIHARVRVVCCDLQDGGTHWQVFLDRGLVVFVFELGLVVVCVEHYDGDVNWPWPYRLTPIVRNDLQSVLARLLAVQAFH